MLIWCKVFINFQNKYYQIHLLEPPPLFLFLLITIVSPSSSKSLTIFVPFGRSISGTCSLEDVALTFDEERLLRLLLRAGFAVLAFVVFIADVLSPGVAKRT